MNENLQDYYLNLEEPNKSCMLALRDIILEQDDNVRETRKWNSPCFCYKNRMFCFLMVDKKLQEPYVLMVEGHRLDFPELIQGDRKRMKTLPIDPNADLPIDLINSILQNAVEFYRNGTIKVKEL